MTPTNPHAERVRRLFGTDRAPQYEATQKQALDALEDAFLVKARWPQFRAALWSRECLDVLHAVGLEVVER